MAKIRSYFLAVRLGLLEHIEDGRLSFDCLGVWLYLAMKCKAGKDNGVVMTNDAALAAAGNMTKRQVATARRKLETMGFIRKMHDGHRKGKYAIILHRYQPTRGSQEVFVDALATTDCNNPVMVPGSHADLITNSSGLQEDPIATSSGTLIAPARRVERLEDRDQRIEEEENPGPSGPASSPDHQTETTKKTQTALEQESAQAWNDVIASVEGCALARVRSKDGVAQFPNSLSKHLRVIRKSGNYDTDEEMIDDLKDRALRLAHDPFCNGQNDRRWVASLHYLMSPSGWDKALGRVLPGQVPTTNGHQSAPRTGEGIMARKCRELREAREAREREEASRVGSR